MPPNEKVEKEKRKKLDRKRWSIEDDERLQELISKNTNLQVLFEGFPDRTEGAIRCRVGIFKKLEKFQADAHRDQSHVPALQKKNGNDELPSLERVKDSHDTYNDDFESSDSGSDYDSLDSKGTMAESAHESLQNSKIQDCGKNQIFESKESKVNLVRAAGPPKLVKVEDSGIVVLDSDSDGEDYPGTAKVFEIPKAVQANEGPARNAQSGVTLPTITGTTEQAGMGVWVPLDVLSQLIRTSKGGESDMNRNASPTAAVAKNTAGRIQPTTSGLAPSRLSTSNPRSPPNTSRLASEITTPKLSTDTTETTTAKRSRSSQLNQEPRNHFGKKPRTMSGANSTTIGPSKLAATGQDFGSRLNSGKKLREEREGL